LQTDSLGDAETGQVQTVSTIRFAFLVVSVATVFTLYIGHVYQTQDMLDELQQLRRENLHLHLHHNQLKGELDKATGPSVIYARAPGLGLQDGFAFTSMVHTE